MAWGGTYIPNRFVRRPAQSISGKEILHPNLNCAVMREFSEENIFNDSLTIICGFLGALRKSTIIEVVNQAQRGNVLWSSEREDDLLGIDCQKLILPYIGYHKKTKYNSIGPLYLSERGVFELTPSARILECPSKFCYGCSGSKVRRPHMMHWYEIDNFRSMLSMLKKYCLDGIMS